MFLALIFIAAGYPQLVQPLTVKNYDNIPGGFSSFLQLEVDGNARAVLGWGNSNSANYAYALQYSDTFHAWQFIMGGYGPWVPMMLTDQTSPLGPGQLLLQNGFWLGPGPQKHFFMTPTQPVSSCQIGDHAFNDTPAVGGYAGWVCAYPGVWHPYGLVLP